MIDVLNKPSYIRWIIGVICVGVIVSGLFYMSASSPSPREIPLSSVENEKAPNDYPVSTSDSGEERTLDKYGHNKYLEEIFSFKAGEVGDGCRLAVEGGTDEIEWKRAAAEFCVQQTQAYLNAACPSQHLEVRESIQTFLEWYKYASDKDVSFFEAMRQALPRCGFENE